MQLYNNFHLNLCVADMVQVFLPQLSARLVVLQCVRTLPCSSNKTSTAAFFLAEYLVSW